MTMKALRPWLLLLLAVLLPLRGAVAASMACALPVPAMAMAMAASIDNGEHAHHHAEPQDTSAQHHATADKCNLCAAAGAATPLPMRSPELQQPATGTALLFPPLAVTVTGFVPDGPERPPRAG